MCLCQLHNYLKLPSIEFESSSLPASLVLPRSVALTDKSVNLPDGNVISRKMKQRRFVYIYIYIYIYMGRTFPASTIH